MSTQKYINVHCNAKLYDLYHGTSFVIVIGTNGEKILKGKLPNGCNPIDWDYEQKYTIYHEACPQDININELIHIINATFRIHYGNCDACFVYGKWAIIESKISDLIKIYDGYF